MIVNCDQRVVITLVMTANNERSNSFVITLIDVLHALLARQSFSSTILVWVIHCLFLLSISFSYGAIYQSFNPIAVWTNGLFSSPSSCFLPFVYPSFFPSCNCYCPLVIAFPLLSLFVKNHFAIGSEDI